MSEIQSRFLSDGYGYKNNNYNNYNYYNNDDMSGYDNRQSGQWGLF